MKLVKHHIIDTIASVEPEKDTVRNIEKNRNALREKRVPEISSDLAT